MNVGQFLELLDGVKSAGAGRWKARCPAHDDTNPSLAVAEGDSDAILIRCWSGCSMQSITASLGIMVSDLFPGKPQIKGLSFMQKQKSLSQSRQKATERKRAAEAIRRAQSILIDCMSICDEITEGRTPTRRTYRYFARQANALLEAEALIRGFDT